MRYAAVLVCLSLLILGVALGEGMLVGSGIQVFVIVDCDRRHHVPTIVEKSFETDGLLRHLAEHGIVATGFVNEGKLAVAGEWNARAAILEAWLDAGHDLGNHTYSHPSLYTTPLADFETDVVRGGDCH